MKTRFLICWLLILGGCYERPADNYIIPGDTKHDLITLFKAAEKYQKLNQGNWPRNIGEIQFILTGSLKQPIDSYRYTPPLGDVNEKTIILSTHNQVWVAETDGTEFLAKVVIDGNGDINPVLILHEGNK